MSMIEPNGGKAIPGIAMPDEVYWVLSTPAPLAGMKYPRQGFPWGELAKSGFVRLVALHPGNYDPAPLTILAADTLQDLVGGGPPRDAEREEQTIARVVRLIVEALRSGDGVAVHCVGGRGRTGCVLGCVLRELGHDAEQVVDYLDRVHKARGKSGWPESPWQAQLVRAWRSDG
jgi:hypothetical protein